MNKKISVDTSYLPGIDGLRAIAVLSVLIYHWDNAAIPGGFTGVDIFFAISGYVISKSLAANTFQTFSEYILGFYRRRFLRIIPALLFCLVVVSALSVAFIPQAWLSDSNASTAKWAFFGASNFYLVSVADGYFSQRIAFNPFVHTWSLAVEEQFYIIFPLLFFFWIKGRKGAVSFRALRAWILPVFALLSLALAFYETHAAHDRAFYLLPSRFWELAAGALLFQWQSYRASARSTSFSPEYLVIAGAVLQVIGFCYIDEARFPFPWALVPVVGTLLMIAGVEGGASAAFGLRKLLESGPVTYIGRISYSLYLWHWPVFVLFRWTVGLNGALQSLSAILLTFALASFSYHFVESTFRRNNFFKRLTNGWVVVASFGAMIFCSYAATFFYDHVHRLGLSVTREKYVWDAYYFPERNSTRPAHSDVGTGRKVLVAGDSHAGAYQIMVNLAAADVGAEAKVFSQLGCSIVRLIVVSADKQGCRDSERAVLDWAKENSRPGDILFLASLRADRLGDQWALFDQNEVVAKAASPERARERAIALEQAEQFIKQCKALGLHVLMDAPMPVFRAPPFRCADWFNRSNPICAPGFTVERDFLVEQRKPAMQSLAVLRDSLGVVVWDPFPVLCDGPVCSAFKEGKPVFMDGDHLSGYGNRLLVPSFAAQLQDIWGARVSAAIPN